MPNGLAFAAVALLDNPDTPIDSILGAYTQQPKQQFIDTPFLVTFNFVSNHYFFNVLQLIKLKLSSEEISIKFHHTQLVRNFQKKSEIFWGLRIEQ
jgi:hypothetical protein